MSTVNQESRWIHCPVCGGKTRTKVTDLLFDSLCYHVWNGIGTEEDIYLAIQILERKTKPILSNTGGIHGSKKLKAIFYLSLIIDGTCSLFKGDFERFVTNFYRVLNEWTEFSEDVFQDIYVVELVLSICTILNILNLGTYADKLYGQYKKRIIDVRSVSAPNKNAASEYARRNYQKYTNRYGVYDIMMLSTSESTVYKGLHRVGI